MYMNLENVFNLSSKLMKELELHSRVISFEMQYLIFNNFLMFLTPK